ncbi:CPBP family intramembrane glutamic endopeptidase [Shewanella baltica]|uniref:CPBP family intramembrane glutamic endopeptidase n=1 Tax=Shewanella baltica TaxID=62322 RepID=UPI00398512BE
MEVKVMRLNLALFFVGFLGIMSVIPFVSQILAMQQGELPMPLFLLKIISVAQSSLMLLLMVFMGSIFAKKVGLTAPVISAMVHSNSIYTALRPQLIPALVGGVLGGVFILVFLGMLSGYLPADFIQAGAKLAPPWYTKVLYGGITEELLIRWGLMSFLVWCSYRLTQRKGADIKVHNYVLAIILSGIIFGVGHLPVAFALTSEATIPLVLYIVLGNAGFGFIAGYLYWKYGLECAMGAHMLAHVTMIICALLVPL